MYRSTLLIWRKNCRFFATGSSSFSICSPSTLVPLVVLYPPMSFAKALILRSLAPLCFLPCSPVVLFFNFRFNFRMYRHRMRSLVTSKTEENLSNPFPPGGYRFSSPFPRFQATLRSRLNFIGREVALSLVRSFGSIQPERKLSFLRAINRERKKWTITRPFP